MKSSFQRALLLATALALPTTTSRAAEELPDFNLADLKIGTTVRGDEVKAEHLKGKVVVVEYWGVT